MRKGQTTFYKTLHRKLETEQREPYLKAAMNSGPSEGEEVIVPQVELVMLPLFQIGDKL